MTTKLYKCPTSDVQKVVVPSVEATALMDIDDGIDPVTLECHSIVCKGNTTFSRNPGLDRTCPKCRILDDVHPIGTFQDDDTEDDLDVSSYGQKAIDTEKPKPKAKPKNAVNKITKVRDGFDIDAERIKICNFYHWNYVECREAFDPDLKDDATPKIMTREYFNHLHDLYVISLDETVPEDATDLMSLFPDLAHLV